MQLNPEIEDALLKIANGKSIKHKNKSIVEINGISIHCRYASGSGVEEQEKYPFNINPNTLTAQYELWVCATSDWYYIIPIDVIKSIYDDPDTYVNKYPGQELIKTVNVIVENDILRFGKNGKQIQITQYWNKFI